MVQREYVAAAVDRLAANNRNTASEANHPAGPGTVSPASGNGQIRLLLAGDVMLGRGIDQVLPHPGATELHEPLVTDARQYVRLAEHANGRIPAPVDFTYVWGDSLALLARFRPDLGIANLETGITTSDTFWPEKSIHYRMHPKNVECLLAGGIDCCVLANNHVMDFGRLGLIETLATLRDAGITTVGAGKDTADAVRPARFSLPGKGDVLVFGCADRSSGVPDSWRAGPNRAGVFLLEDLSVATAEHVVEHIHRFRRSSDIVIVSIHWGDNWDSRVSAEQRLFAGHLVEYGDVAIVHGHSSHHTRPIQIVSNRLVLYGCGDLLNDYEGIPGREQYKPALGAMHLVTISASSRQLERLEIAPFQLRRFRLLVAPPEDRLWLRHRLNHSDHEFGTFFDTRGTYLHARLPREQPAKLSP